MTLYMHFYQIASIQMDDNLYKRENRVKDRREERGLWPEKKTETRNEIENLQRDKQKKFE